MSKVTPLPTRVRARPDLVRRTRQIQITAAALAAAGTFALAGLRWFLDSRREQQEQKERERRARLQFLFLNGPRPTMAPSPWRPSGQPRPPVSAPVPSSTTEPASDVQGLRDRIEQLEEALRGQPSLHFERRSERVREILRAGGGRGAAEFDA